MIVKPPNVLIYTDTIDTGKSVKAVLRKVLDPDRYVKLGFTIQLYVIDDNKLWQFFSELGIFVSRIISHK